MRFHPRFLIAFKISCKRNADADFGDFLLTFLEVIDKFKAAAFDGDVAHRKHCFTAVIGTFHKVVYQIRDIETLLTFTDQTHHRPFYR